MKNYGPYQPPINMGDGGGGTTYFPDPATGDTGGVPPMATGSPAWAEKQEIQRLARAKALRANPMFRKHDGPSPWKEGENPNMFNTFADVQDANLYRLRKYEVSGTNKTVDGKREWDKLPALYKPTRAY